MAFDLETFFYDIFRPEEGEKVTIMFDFPHDHIKDNIEWKERRLMAEQWREKLNNIKQHPMNVAFFCQPFKMTEAFIEAVCFCGTGW